MNSFTSAEPVYLRLAAVLEGMIHNRTFSPGDRMPSVRDFSRQQRVSVPTALKAYVMLETRGLINARPKSGFFVRPRQADLLREPSDVTAAPKITEISATDPLDSVLSDHGNKKLVPLGAAIPNYSLLPAEKLARTMGAIARKLGSESIGYDMAPGSEMVRREIARRSLSWGCSLKAEDFIITIGGTEALALALRATSKPGDTVAIESPTYYGLVHMLRELSLNVLPVPMDGVNGIDVNALERAVKRTKVSACVLIPNFNNPTGALMPDENKQRVVEFLAKRNVPIIEDDIYGDLQHDGMRPHCLKKFDRDGNVLLCSSFSKSLAPGYRVGYIAPGRFYKRVMLLKKASTLANSSLPTLAVGEFLRDGGYDRYLRGLRATYKDQVARMREAIAETFPEGIGLSRPTGGFVLWVELPKKTDSIELFRQARAAGISIAPGPLFSAEGGFRNFIRLNCGEPWDARIERAIGILGHLVERLSNR